MHLDLFILYLLKLWIFFYDYDNLLLSDCSKRKSLSEKEFQNIFNAFCPFFAIYLVLKKTVFTGE